MSVLDKFRVIIYRVHEKGLEVFLVNTGLNEESWKIPFGEIAKYNDDNPAGQINIIDLDPIDNGDGEILQAVAIEGDWHDIPSIRKLIKKDVELVTNKIADFLPEGEKGAYFALKEAIKKVMPNEYQALHELKEIILHRNLIQNI